MMSAGLEKQLLRCNGTGDHPDFCNNTSVYGNVLKAYNNLWDSIEQVQSQLRTEVWSWVYDNGFVLTPLGDLPAPDGAEQTESDIVQVCSFALYCHSCIVMEFDGGLCGLEEFSSVNLVA
jgi:hypothetical protein